MDWTRGQPGHISQKRWPQMLSYHNNFTRNLRFDLKPSTDMDDEKNPEISLDKMHSWPNPTKSGSNR